MFNLSLPELFTVPLPSLSGSLDQNSFSFPFQSVNLVDKGLSFAFSLLPSLFFFAKNRKQKSQLKYFYMVSSFSYSLRLNYNLKLRLLQSFQVPEEQGPNKGRIN